MIEKKTDAFFIIYLDSVQNNPNTTLEKTSGEDY